MEWFPHNNKLSTSDETDPPATPATVKPFLHRRRSPRLRSSRSGLPWTPRSPRPPAPTPARIAQIQQRNCKNRPLGALCPISGRAPQHSYCSTGQGRRWPLRWHRSCCWRSYLAACQVVVHRPHRGRWIVSSRRRLGGAHSPVRPIFLVAARPGGVGKRRPACLLVSTLV